MSLSPRQLATDRSKAVIWCNSYLMFFGVGVGVGWSRCFMSYFFVGYLYVSGNGLITSFGEERANLSAIVHI